MEHPEAPRPPIRVPDPGSRAMARAAMAVLVLLVGATFWLQQASTRTGASESHARSRLDPGRVADPHALGARIAVKLGADLPADSPLRPILAEQAVPRGAAERVRSAMVVGEVVGPGAALEALSSAEASPGWPAAVERDPALADDLRTLRALYRDGRDEAGDAALASLADRHGWYGRVAGAFGLPETDPRRASLISGGHGLAWTLGLFTVALCVAVVGGVTASVVFAVALAGRKLKPVMAAPAPGGSVYLETAVVFFVLFLALKVGLGVLGSGLDPHRGQVVAMSLQWGVALAVFWPLVRGVSWSHWRADMGLHAGRGVWREVGAGVAGYLASMPLLAVALAVSYAMVWLRSRSSAGVGGVGDGPSAGEATNPIIEAMAQPAPVPVMLLLLATVWAPLVEEAVFRGALYRHLRSRLGVVLAAGAAGVVFGVGHGYPWYALLPVITLGVVFALMRHWRGSLVASMTAHALNNAVVAGFMYALVAFAGD
ncbi:MAG: CPBP family intramembrane metalloprotease [Phycisphaeraceae bacterium]|nr:MAG: CPBP family intramembrane metalloprotease [Phycisphaeraceae bacterium]